MFRRLNYPLMLWILCLGPAHAVQVAGVEVPEQVVIAGFDRPLTLNGAGVRKKFFISVYVGALYLPQRQTGVGSLLTEPTANRVAMHFVHREVEKRKLDDAWREGFENNLSAPALAALEARLNRFMTLFRDMRKGDSVFLDYVPGRATEVWVNGAKQGEIEGADFNAALLAVWLGERPVTVSLKKAMVGVDKP